MTFDAQLQSLTLHYIVPKVVDDFLGSNAITLLFLSNGKPWYGETLRFPIKYQKNTQGGSFADMDEFSTNNQNTRVVAQFDPRGYYQSVVIGGIARSVNNISKTQVLNLVKVEMESVKQDMIDSVGTLFYGDGTGNGNKDFLGFKAGIDDGTGVDTYGAISRASYSAWKSTLTTSIGAFSFQQARTIWNNATVGNQRPTIGFTNKSTFVYIENKYQAVVQGRYDVLDANRVRLTSKGVMPATRDALLGQAGFDGIFFSGTPIIKDDKATSGYLFAANNNYYAFYGVEAVEADPISLDALYVEGNDYEGGAPSPKGFAWTGFVRPAKQYAWIGQFLLLGNFLTPASRLQTYGSGITS